MSLNTRIQAFFTSHHPAHLHRKMGEEDSRGAGLSDTCSVTEQHCTDAQHYVWGFTNSRFFRGIDSLV